MPITWRIRGELGSPIVLCDVCRQQITSVYGALYLFNINDRLAPLVFLHGGPCLALWNDLERPGPWGHGRLNTLWTMLRNNMGQTEAEAAKAAESHARMSEALGAPWR